MKVVDVERRTRAVRHKTAEEQRCERRQQRLTLDGAIGQRFCNGYLNQSVCPNCGGPGPHFAPPCFGEPGFFMCEAGNG